MFSGLRFSLFVEKLSVCLLVKGVLPPPRKREKDVHTFCTVPLKKAFLRFYPFACFDLTWPVSVNVSTSSVAGKPHASVNAPTPSAAGECFNLPKFRQ